jgi:adenine phosphoribosyltransferase
MLQKLKKSLLKAPILHKGNYKYFVHPITDGIPLVESDILIEVVDAILKYANLKVDKIVCIEAMGIHIATALSLKTEIPFVVVRKRRYNLEGEIAVHQETGYSEAELYINGVEKGDKIILVDDVLSTGGTMVAVLKALKNLGAEIIDIMAVIEKGNGKEIVERKTGFKVKTLVRVDIKDDNLIITDFT